MNIVKMNLRSFLRREQTNKGLKIECTVRIINMYRVNVDPTNGFYRECATQIASEFEGNKAFTQIDQNSHNTGILQSLL